MIKTGKIGTDVQKFVDPSMQMRRLYERGVSNAARRNSIEGIVDEFSDF
jgi:hypothetical protein